MAITTGVWMKAGLAAHEKAPKLPVSARSCDNPLFWGMGGTGPEHARKTREK
jgi:hypothetical protein